MFKSIYEFMSAPLEISSDINKFNEVIKNDNIMDEINEKGVILLYIESGMLEFVEALIKNGANIQIVDIDGFTPLDYAISFEMYDIVELLVDSGFKLVYNGCSAPLVDAINTNNIKIVELLLASYTKESLDIPVNTGIYAGAYPLHLAIYNPYILLLLIRYGFDINRETDNHIYNVLEAAIYNNAPPEIIEILIDAGADTECLKNDARVMKIIDDNYKPSEIEFFKKLESGELVLNKYNQ